MHRALYNSNEGSLVFSKTVTEREMETILFGLILSSGMNRWGEVRTGMELGSGRMCFLQPPIPQEASKLLFSMSFGGMVWFTLKICNKRLRGRKVCRGKKASLILSPKLHTLSFLFYNERNGIIWLKTRDPLPTQSLLPTSVYLHLNQKWNWKWQFQIGYLASYNF